MNKEEKRLRRDDETLFAMAKIYCADHCEGPRDERDLCEECRATIEYGMERTRKCPNEHKGNCEDCSIHCYKPEMREHIREIMAYAGPRMPLRHPVYTYYYLKKKLAKKK